ncbi:metal ABC transporter substrate-binding protein [Lancefieldella parvula]|uniref:metal ABC transporter substrate-binding protein n=1 Tax=Lancefieldella parvula TaxID=1382 RepID=UPI0028F0AB14|nr:metal ABC transporter substrate-binding protein [Lancefieldella parvula]
MKHHCTHCSTAANLRSHTNLQPHAHRNPLLTRRSTLSLIITSSTIAIASLSACGSRNSATNSGSTSNQNSSTPLVLTTFTVIQDMASRVAGEFCQVESITKAGAEIHDYEPTPDDLKRAQKAQLILNNGLGLERWFERFVDESPAQRADLSEGITAIPIAEGDFQGQANPHAWMSPENGKIYVENIVRALSSLVPDHTKDFEANGDAYKKELDNISSRLIEELSALPENQRTLVTCEGAFSYLCRDTNMKELYLWAVNAADEGTPQQIAKVVEAVKSQQIPAVFCESTVNPKAMQQVADETGATLKTDEKNILYVDSLSEADGPVPTYLDLLQHDADAIVSGLMGR